MKKILVITPFFYPHIGGSEKYMERLYAFIKRKNPKLSIDILCYNTERVKGVERYKGLTVYRIPCWNLLPGQFALPNPISVFKFLKKKGETYDLIHCSTRFFDSSWWGVVYAKLAGGKAILTDHCAYHPVSQNKLVSLIAKVIDLTIVSLFLRFFDKVYVESKATQRFLKKTFNISSKVAYPGVDTSQKQVQRNGKVKVLFVGRLVESKGVKELTNIASKMSQADFIIVGDGPLLSFLRKKRSKNIKITGPLRENEVQKLLNSSHIFAYPSFHSEGIPLSIVEAAGSGIAVLATNVGGIGEVIKDGKSGVLVENIEEFELELQRLVKNRGLRERLGKNLKEFAVKSFLWERNAKNYLRELRA